MDRGNHYEAAFEAFLRERHLPYIAVDETRRTELGGAAVKSLDFLVMPDASPRLLIDIKGRRFPGGPVGKPRHVWETWSTRDDVDGLTRWQARLGPDAVGLLAFVYALAPDLRLPDDTPDVWSFRDRSYLCRTVPVDSYRRWMRTRSPRWDTVCLPGDVFREIAQPLSDFAPADILWPA